MQLIIITDCKAVLRRISPMLLEGNVQEVEDEFSVFVDVQEINGEFKYSIDDKEMPDFLDRANEAARKGLIDYHWC